MFSLITLQITNVASHALLRKFLKIQILAAEGFKFPAVGMQPQHVHGGDVLGQG
jgi:hypothetical protein